MEEEEESGRPVWKARAAHTAHGAPAPAPIILRARCAWSGEGGTALEGDGSGGHGVPEGVVQEEPLLPLDQECAEGQQVRPGHRCLQRRPGRPAEEEMQRHHDRPRRRFTPDLPVHQEAARPRGRLRAKSSSPSRTHLLSAFSRPRGTAAPADARGASSCPLRPWAPPARQSRTSAAESHERGRVARARPSRTSAAEWPGVFFSSRF